MSVSYTPVAIEDALRPDGAPDGATDQPWSVTTLGEADWTARKIAQAQRKIDTVQQERDRLVAKIDGWAERETAGAQRDVSFFESKLISWLQVELAADPDGKKSRALPSGAVVKRVAGRERLEVDDDRALAEWLESQDDEAVRALVKSWDPKIDRSGVKMLATTWGEVPPGARLERGDDTYAVVIP